MASTTVGSDTALVWPMPSCPHAFLPHANASSRRSSSFGLTEVLARDRFSLECSSRGMCTDVDELRCDSTSARSSTFFRVGDLVRAGGTISRCATSTLLLSFLYSVRNRRAVTHCSYSSTVRATTSSDLLSSLSPSLFFFPSPPSSFFALFSSTLLSPYMSEKDRCSTSGLACRAKTGVLCPSRTSVTFDSCIFRQSSSLFGLYHSSLLRSDDSLNFLK
mmetsp:Transcript_43083/g.111631  ORF Transcript_43083/g.111631 Transcript_43083/m.111631 type:complete len:219 (-) Transcript_43083:116-772(-)